MAKKIIHLGVLDSFWSKIETWVSLNLQNLYDNDEEQEKAIQKVRTDLHDVEETFSTAINNVDVVVDERVNYRLGAVERTLATAWDDLDRRIRTTEQR